MYLTKLTVNPRSAQVRRDLADVHNMHRTVMSAYPERAEMPTFRQTHGVLWRIDTVQDGLMQYVQSRTA
jgi:CRISPR system Cascade subunit CasE